MFRQFSFIGLFSACYGFTVVTVSGLEAVSGGAYVGLCNVVVGCGNLGLVTLARSSCLQYSFVVSVNESFHVFATTVAYAYAVSVKKFRKLVIGRKVFVNKGLFI